ncbi:hypothetical protein ACHAQD_005278 [Fusarium lateritium]
MELSVVDYAWAVAETLAILHWRARIDAYDVEFVLGSEALSKTEATTRIWFEKQVAIEHPNRVIDQLVDSFFENDPYYLRPESNGEVERQLWDTFKNAYVLKAETVLYMGGPDSILSRLPQKFIAACIERGAKGVSTSPEI